MAGRTATLALLVVALGGCSLITRPEPPRAPSAPGPGAAVPPGDWIEEGIASWYGRPFHGRQTASGERYDMEAPTAAHQSLPFGTVVEVHNLDNDRRARLRINDRGPFVGERILDVSRAGARDLGMLGPGLARVRLAIVEAAPVQRCWEVQTGSFASPENASSLQRRLAAAGEEARVEADPDGLHRVLLGPFTTQADATAAATRNGGLTRAC